MNQRHSPPHSHKGIIQLGHRLGVEVHGATGCESLTYDRGGSDSTVEVRTAKEWLTLLFLRLTERPTAPRYCSFPSILPSFYPYSLYLDASSMSNQGPTYPSGPS